MFDKIWTPKAYDKDIAQKFVIFASYVYRYIKGKLNITVLVGVLHGYARALLRAA